METLYEKVGEFRENPDISLQLLKGQFFAKIAIFWESWHVCRGLIEKPSWEWLIKPGGLPREFMVIMEDCIN